MKATVEIPDELLKKATHISGLPSEDVILIALKEYVTHHELSDIRTFGEDHSDFEFWKDEREDLYNDLIDSK